MVIVLQIGLGIAWGAGPIFLFALAFRKVRRLRRARISAMQD